MNETLNQSAKALQAQIEASRLDQRAWVMAESIATQGEFSEGSNMSVQVAITNSGLSPALAVETQSVLNVVLVNSALLPLRPPVYEPSKSVIGPHEISFIQSNAIPLTAPRVQAIKQGIVVLRVVGVIHYRDIFNKPHGTGFCLEWPYEPGRTEKTLWSNCSAKVGGNWAN